MVPKFRAWDKENKLMVTNFHRSHMKIETGKVLYQLTTTNENEIKSIASYNTFDDFTYRYSHDLELMQSTGLKDKNGVEIFEGDIVVIKYSEHGYHYYEKIVFENGTFTAGDEDWLYNIKDYCVVCGNIYENPELLEPANE